MSTFVELLRMMRREILYHFRLQCRYCGAITDHCHPNCPGRKNCCEWCAR